MQRFSHHCNNQELSSGHLLRQSSTATVIHCNDHPLRRSSAACWNAGLWRRHDRLVWAISAWSYPAHLWGKRDSHFSSCFLSSSSSLPRNKVANQLNQRLCDLLTSLMTYLLFVILTCYYCDGHYEGTIVGELDMCVELIYYYGGRAEALMYLTPYTIRWPTSSSPSQHEARKLGTSSANVSSTASPAPLCQHSVSSGVIGQAWEEKTHTQLTTRDEADTQWRQDKRATVKRTDVP